MSYKRTEILSWLGSLVQRAQVDWKREVKKDCSQLRLYDNTRPKSYFTQSIKGCDTWSAVLLRTERCRGAGTASSPELGTSSENRIENCKYYAAFLSGVRLEGSPSYTRPMRPELIFSKGIVRKVGFQSLALRGENRTCSFYRWYFQVRIIWWVELPSRCAKANSCRTKKSAT